MRTECLPLKAIPHLTPLYSDFISQSSKVSSFYAAPSSDPNHKQAVLQGYSEQNRKNVAEILERQNRGWKASAKTLDNITRLRNGASAFVTGQQVTLFGGPMFAILKAQTAIKHAEAATKAGADCVPIFWLASEDHDLEEVSSVTLLDGGGSLRKINLHVRAAQNVPVGAISFGSEINAAVDEAAKTFADEEICALVRDCYHAGETFAGAFAKLFARLFAEYGLILLDPSDTDLHNLAKPVLRAAAEQSAELNSDLLARGKELESAGYHAQVKVTTTSTALFGLQQGARLPVQRANGNFSIGKERLSADELVGRIDAHPQDFSGNALLRPVIQDFLLPTLAYVGGPAEIAYFAQSEVLYKKLLGRVTPILPRLSATLVDAKAQRLLTRYGLTLPETFVAEEELKRKIADRSLPADLATAFDSTRSAIEDGLTELSTRLRTLDPTLNEAAKRSASKMMYQLARLKQRAGVSESRRNSDIERQARFLSSTLYPHKDLQERSLAGISLLGRHGLGLLQQMYESLDLQCSGHQVLNL